MPTARDPRGRPQAATAADHHNTNTTTNSNTITPAIAATTATAQKWTELTANSGYVRHFRCPCTASRCA